MATPTSLLQVRLPVTVGTGDVNYVLNPSAEAGSGSTPSNATAVSTATVTRVTTYARQVTPDSSYSYRVQTSTTNAGLQLTTASLPSGSIYMSAWVRGSYTAANLRFKCNATTVTPTLYETDGAWSWFVLEASTAFSGMSGQTTVQILHTTTGADFYVDDVVVQAGALTTAFHGSYPGCRWNGIAHQASSQALPLVENEPNTAVGVIYDIDSATTAVINHVIGKAMGLGLPSIDNLTQKQVGAGEVYVSSQLGSRNIVLNSSLITTSLANQHTQRASLIDYLPPGRKFILRYRGNPTYNGGTNDVTELTCVYQQGLAGNLELPTFENLSLTLTAYDPLFYPSSETATALSMAQSLTLSYWMKRALGVWSVPGGGTSPDIFVNALATSPKGHIYAGGLNGNWNLKGWDGTTVADCGVMVGGNKVIYALAFDPSGTYLYVGGDFTTSIGGVASTAYIGRYALPSSGTSGGTWASLGNMNGVVRSLVTVPTSSGHDLYAFGDFTTAGGTSANYAAKWNGSAWSALGPNTASATRIRAAVYDNADTIYLGGEWTSLGTLSTPGTPTVTNGSGSLSSGNWGYAIVARTVNGTTAASAIGASGTSATGKNVSWGAVTGAVSYDVYREQSPGVGAALLKFLVNTTATSYADTGSITLSTQDEPTTATDGVRTTNIGYYSISKNSFAGVGTTGTNGAVKALALAPDTTLYLGGSFTVADGAAINRVAQYNGMVITALSSGTTDGVTGGDVESLAVLPTGEVAVGGAFTGLNAPNVGTLGANFAYWLPNQSGSGTWVPADITYPGSTTVFAIMVDLNGDLWTGQNTTGSGTTSVATTVTASGMAGVFQSYPRLYVVGPGLLRYLENQTTGYKIWLNLPIATDEVVTLDFRLGNKSITSSLGNAPRAYRFLAGDMDLFGLLNGTNKIVVYYTGTSGNATIRLSDPATRLSADG